MNTSQRGRRRRLSVGMRCWIVATLLLGGCEQVREPVPPVIYFGQHECDVCRMIISDDRYAAAIVIENESGRYEHRLFDDIGCLLQYENDEPDEQIAARYVRNAEDGDWIEFADAVFLHSQSLKTPMAFHIAALRSQEQATRWQQEHSGDILDLKTVRQRFVDGTLRSF